MQLQQARGAIRVRHAWFFHISMIILMTKSKCELECKSWRICWYPVILPLEVAAPLAAPIREAASPSSAASQNMVHGYLHVQVKTGKILKEFFLKEIIHFAPFYGYSRRMMKNDQWSTKNSAQNVWSRKILPKSSCSVLAIQLWARDFWWNKITHEKLEKNAKSHKRSPSLIWNTIYWKR